MVVNKLQSENPWNSYTRSPLSNSATSEDWMFNGVINESDTVNVTEHLVKWKNTFNMRQVNLQNMVENINDNGSSKISMTAAKMHGRNVVNAAKSLDLLRQNIQSAINSDIDRVIKKYLDMFFAPAINNIGGNLGPGIVNEEHIREVCRTMLDEAKHLYLNSPLSRNDSPFNEGSNTNILIESRFGNSQYDIDKDKRLCISYCQMKNDPQRINSKTLFIHSSRVDEVIENGGVQGPLHLIHPELFRYRIDMEDREWLTKNKLDYSTAQNPGSSCVLILEDIQELLISDAYMHNANIPRHELKGFEAPEFMLKKISLAMTSRKNYFSSQVTQNRDDVGLASSNINLKADESLNNNFQKLKNFLNEDVPLKKSL